MLLETAQTHTSFIVTGQLCLTRFLDPHRVRSENYCRVFYHNLQHHMSATIPYVNGLISNLNYIVTVDE